MAFDFKSITAEDEKTVAEKFRAYGKGINMGRYSANVATGAVAKWKDLINPAMYNMHDIKNKALEIGTRINTTVSDDTWGEMEEAFVHVTERDEKISFTWIECYTFLRAAYKYRQETVEYKNKKKQVDELKSFLESNKTKTQKIKEARKELESLMKEL
jgi:hypothetical protein